MILQRQLSVSFGQVTVRDTGLNAKNLGCPPTISKPIGKEPPNCCVHKPPFKNHHPAGVPVISPVIISKTYTIHSSQVSRHGRILTDHVTAVRKIPSLGLESSDLCRSFQQNHTTEEKSNQINQLRHPRVLPGAPTCSYHPHVPSQALGSSRLPVASAS